MDTATLASAMGCSRAVAERYVGPCNAAMLTAGCTTRNRAAMWCAQLGHESAGLRYMEEIASGAAYEGRRDLGNTVRGDGRRFKGRGPIQITGRANYTAVSRWAHGRGLVPTPTYFVDHPAELASDRYVFLGPVWYWTVARARINAMCDAGDLVGVTRAINGGTNGLADRRNRWDRCRGLGDRILPSVNAPGAPRQPPPPLPAPQPLFGDDPMIYVKSPEPTKDQPKREWPTIRVPLAFEPGTGLLKVDHCGRGGWIHLGRWWLRAKAWNPNVPLHDHQDHPVGPNGSERFVGFGWVTGAPPAADMIEIVLSCPDGAVIQWWRTK
jgi:predicted chitinase